MDEKPRVISDKVRYQPKSVDDPEWIESFLAEQPTGVLGLVDDGLPYVVTQLFVYDEDAAAIYLHGASAGRTHTIVERGHPDTPATFTVSEMGRFIPHQVPMEFTVEYASVDVFGSIRLVEDDTEKRHALERFMTELAPHLHPGEDYEPIAEKNMDVTAVYRLDVEEWSGKRGQKDPAHPGAYTLDEVRDMESID